MGGLGYFTHLYPIAVLKTNMICLKQKDMAPTVV
jgi:hypothetical protein